MCVVWVCVCVCVCSVGVTFDFSQGGKNAGCGCSRTGSGGRCLGLGGRKRHVSGDNIILVSFVTGRGRGVLVE